MVPSLVLELGQVDVGDDLGVLEFDVVNAQYLQRSKHFSKMKLI